MTLFLPVRDRQPAVVVSWIACFHLFTSSSGIHDSICGSFEHMERYQPPRLFSVAFQIFCNRFQFFWACFFSCPVGAFIHSVSFPSCASWSLQTLWIPCFRDALYLVGPHFAAGQPPCRTYRKMKGKGKGAAAQALDRREKAQQRQHPRAWGCRSAQERGSRPVFAPEAPSGWAPPAVNACSSGNNPHVMGQLCG